MKTEHDDKQWRPGTLLGRKEFMADLVQAEAWRRANLDPADRAALPTKQEQALLDEADRAYAARQAAYGAAQATLAAAHEAAYAGREIVRSRARGDVVERPVADDAEQARLDAAVAAAQRALEAETAQLQNALRDGNRVRRDVAAAGARRRQSIHREGDFRGWLAFRRAHGDARSDSELRDQWEHKGRYSTLTIRVRNGGR